MTTSTLSDRIEAARAAGDWDLHAKLWEERRVAEVDADEARLASTIPACTVIEIRADIALIQGMLDRCDAFQHDLRNEPARFDDWVVGLPKYGVYLDRQSQFGKVTAAAIYRTKAQAFNAGGGRCNKVGEYVEPVLYSVALEGVLQGQLKLHTSLCGIFQDLSAQLVEAQAYEAHLDDTAEAERVLADYRLDQRL